MTEVPKRCALASHTHLFPGALLRFAADGSDMDALPEPQLLSISFSDGSQSRAELVVAAGGARRETALIVEPYRTAAGTKMPQKIWLIAGQSSENGAIILRIGQQLPFDA